MTNVPLGAHAYKRNFGAMPEIKLVNRFVEKDPSNLREKMALLSRPGTTLLGFFAGEAVSDPIRGLYSKPGLFGNDLFIVVGSKLYRRAEDGTTTLINAFIGGTGKPYLTWDKGLTYEHMFISDGQVLSYYAGGSRATGVLVATVTPTDQVLQIGSTYYAWATDVNPVTPPDGTLAHPFLVLLTTDPFQTMADAIIYIGTPGTDFSSTMGGPNGEVTAFATPSSSAKGTLTLTGAVTTQEIEIGGVYYSWNVSVDSGAPDGTVGHPYLANPGSDPIAAMVKLLMFTGVAGTDYSTAVPAASTTVTAVAAGGPPATELQLTAITAGAPGNLVTTSVVTGTGMAWGGATLSGGTSNGLTLTAISEGTDANLIALNVTGTAGIAFTAALMAGGGAHTIHQITVPTGEGISSLANIGHFIMCAVTESIKFFYLRPGSVVMDVLDYASKESNPDPIIDLIVAGDFVYVLGTGSIEVWYSTGQNDNPLGPVVGRTMARGIVPGTAVNVKDDIVFVGNDGIVYTMNNGPVAVSDNAIAERIRIQLRREKGLTA